MVESCHNNEGNTGHCTDDSPVSMTLLLMVLILTHGYVTLAEVFKLLDPFLDATVGKPVCLQRFRKNLRVFLHLLLNCGLREVLLHLRGQLIPGHFKPLLGQLLTMHGDKLGITTSDHATSEAVLYHLQVVY